MRWSTTVSIALSALGASRFIEKLVRPHVIQDDLDAAYAAMASDDEREREALDWSEAFFGEVGDETG